MAKINFDIAISGTDVALPFRVCMAETADKVDVNMYIQILFFVIVIGICNHNEENLWRGDDNNNPGDVDR